MNSIVENVQKLLDIYQDIGNFIELEQPISVNSSIITLIMPRNLRCKWNVFWSNLPPSNDSFKRKLDGTRCVF